MLTFLVLFFGFFFSFMSLASLLKPLFWVFDVLTHFNLQYFLALALCLVVGISLGVRPYILLLFALALLANAYILLPFFWPQRRLEPTTNPLRVIALNVLTSNRQYDRITTYLREANADLVLLAEIEPELMARIRTSLAKLL
jgi:endonuclease/exonuclease/phosphatase (EEP) superfamily protein YafD